jgi:group I intron endonuclease
MIKRVLKSRSPAGIYKITLLETGEAYIGRSTDVSKRWLEHIKSSFNLGTIAHSSLHIRMAKEGLWNFSFELLEEVDKDKLSEREKYWIDFYKTKEFGLNDKAGG